ncbi:MAG: hypothetical protein K940chlam7_01327 [Chlamydiae bacterium]|nr:hypothetical protein [Chlamydiota bacterium]
MTSPIPPFSRDYAMSQVPETTDPLSGLEKIERSFPPVGLMDAVEIRGGKECSIYGEVNMFDDEEILQIHKIIEEKEIGRHVSAGISENGKHVIQQQGTRGCTAAVAAMLIMDHGKQPEILELISRDLGTEQDTIRDIKNAGLEHILHAVADFEKLKPLLDDHGSAIVTIEDKMLGSHEVVVDEITGESVRLRDPYHGWEITVTLKAFTERFVPFDPKVAAELKAIADRPHRFKRPNLDSEFGNVIQIKGPSS